MVGVKVASGITNKATNINTQEKKAVHCKSADQNLHGVTSFLSLNQDQICHVILKLKRKIRLPHKLIEV